MLIHKVVKGFVILKIGMTNTIRQQRRALTGNIGKQHWILKPVNNANVSMERFMP